MLRSDQRKTKILAFTLVELAIVLGVVGIISGGLWRLMATGSQMTKDQATAQQQLVLINAVASYLADTSANSGQDLLKALGPNATTTVTLPTSNTGVANCQANIGGGNNKGLCNFLPTGFVNTTTNPYGQTYTIRALKDGAAAGTAPTSYSFMIVASGGPLPIPDTNGGRISGLIGGDGGFIYSSLAVCGSTAPIACGTMSAWSTSTANYGYGVAPIAAPPAGSIVSRTFAASSASNLWWLARGVMPNDSTGPTAFTYNTMTTDLFMGNWIPTVANPNPTQAPGEAAPSIHLGGINNLNILYGASAITMPQLIMTASSQGAYNQAPIQIATGCSQMNLGGIVPPCPTTGSAALGNLQIIPAIYVVTGDIYVANGEVTATKLYSASDARLKKDIHKIENPLDDLMKIDAIGFTFKEGGSQSMGVTAQNLEKVYPQLVSQNGGTKYVEYNGLIGPLIGAIQELKRQNDDLRTQLHQQSLRQDRLDKKMQGSTAP